MGLDIGKATDAVVQTEYMYEELSTKIRSVNLLKFRERAVFPKCETSEGLCAKARDFKHVFDRLQQLFRGKKMLLAEGAKG